MNTIKMEKSIPHVHPNRCCYGNQRRPQTLKQTRGKGPVIAEKEVGKRYLKAYNVFIHLCTKEWGRRIRVSLGKRQQKRPPEDLRICGSLVTKLIFKELSGLVWLKTGTRGELLQAKIRVSTIANNLLTSTETLSFSRRTLLHGTEYILNKSLDCAVRRAKLRARRGSNPANGKKFFSSPKS